MTEQEQNAIIADLLAAIRENSKTIEQLVPATQINDDDRFEITGGRSVQFRDLFDSFSAISDEALLSINTRITNSIAAEEQARADADSALGEELEALTGTVGTLKETLTPIRVAIGTAVITQLDSLTADCKAGRIIRVTEENGAGAGIMMCYTNMAHSAYHQILVTSRRLTASGALDMSTSYTGESHVLSRHMGVDNAIGETPKGTWTPWNEIAGDGMAARFDELSESITTDIEARLTAEETARQAADATLSGDIEALKASVNDNISVALEAVRTAQGEEEAARQAADTALKAEIDDLRAQTAMGIEIDSETGDVALVYDEDNGTIDSARVNALTGDIEITLNL